MPTTITREYKPQPAKWLLVQAHFRQRDVVELSGASASQVSGSLNGRITPARRIADACVELLGRPVEELFDRVLLEASHWYVAPAGGDDDE